MIKNKIHYCDDCYEYGNLTEATRIQEPDPFQEEINNDITPVDLCDSCYRSSLHDI